ncbi:PREDICTED: uncharacterized protein LOC106101786 [Papilio polytes]|uniref:uncharacterized protein LOC106101786 n=1 Tax=Papilio polytes TaxID=76194 RepID=UPI000676AFAC|nr:PREDICTED: uncharacterized protein LOC106101786 [Papilio polytes]
MNTNGTQTRSNGTTDGTFVEMDEMQKKEEADPNGAIIHEKLDYEPSGWFELTLSKAGSSTEDFLKKNSSAMKTIAIFVLNGLVVGFFFGCLYYWMNHSNKPLELCHGFGSLIAFLSIVYFFVIYFLVVKRYFGEWFEKVVWTRVETISYCLWKMIWFRWCFCVCVLAAVAVFLYLDTRDAPERLISLLGLIVLLLLVNLTVCFQTVKLSKYQFSSSHSFLYTLINCFSLQSESALIIKPYLALLTPSEIHVVMSSGFATVSGTILAAYIAFGAEPAHLVTASVMSAPAALCYAKLLLPETRRSRTAVHNLQPVHMIMIGAISAMAPAQRETLSSVAVRAFFTGCGICFMTACIAGLLMPEGSFG